MLRRGRLGKVDKTYISRLLLTNDSNLVPITAAPNVYSLLIRSIRDRAWRCAAVAIPDRSKLIPFGSVPDKAETALRRDLGLRKEINTGSLFSG
jgi:hypothetical protein